VGGGSRGRKSQIPKRRKGPPNAEIREEAEGKKAHKTMHVFSLLRKKLCGLRVLCGDIFFFIREGAEILMIT